MAVITATAPTVHRSAPATPGVPVRALATLVVALVVGIAGVAIAQPWILVLAGLAGAIAGPVLLVRDALGSWQG